MAVPTTKKLLGVTQHNSKQLRVLTISDEGDCRLVKIFEDAVSVQEEKEQYQNIPIIETNNNFHISLCSV